MPDQADELFAQLVERCYAMPEIARVAVIMVGNIVTVELLTHPVDYNDQECMAQLDAFAKKIDRETQRAFPSSGVFVDFKVTPLELSPREMLMIPPEDLVCHTTGPKYSIN